MRILAKNKLLDSKQDIPLTFVSCEIREEIRELSGLEVQSKEISKHFLFWEGTVLKVQF